MTLNEQSSRYIEERESTDQSKINSGELVIKDSPIAETTHETEVSQQLKSKDID